MAALGLVGLGALGASSGCAARQRRAEEGARLSVEIAELRAQQRRDRRQIQDLERRLVLDAAPPAPAGAEPIVVQDAPTAPVPPAPQAPPSDPPEGEPITGLSDDSGVEVIYEGEAAEPVTRRQRLTLHERTSFADRDEARGGARARVVATELPPVPVAGETLAVTRGEVPSVSGQLRRARSAPARAARPVGPPSDPRADYQRYQAALAAGNHAYATTGFRGFVERWPEHELADNAQYWLGESFYDQKDFARAEAEFRRVGDRYPRGNKVADALLKIGFCQLAVGKRDEARKTLHQVTELYPRSAPAALARERLAALPRTP